jgi:hypothetical protein
VIAHTREYANQQHCDTDIDVARGPSIDIIRSDKEGSAVAAAAFGAMRVSAGRPGRIEQPADRIGYCQPHAFLRSQ